jgi:hypothetical protein
MLGSESHGTHGHILLSDGFGSIQTSSAVHVLNLVVHRQTHRLSSETIRTAQRTTRPVTLLLHVFVAAGTFLQIPHLATHTGTYTDGTGLGNTPLRWAQGAVICVPILVKIGSGIQKLI